MARKKKGGRPGPESAPAEQLQQMSLDSQASAPHSSASSRSGTASSAPGVASTTGSAGQASSGQGSAAPQSAPVSHAQTSPPNVSVLATKQLVSGKFAPKLPPGIKGKKIRVLVNLFKLDIGSTKGILTFYHYDFEVRRVKKPARRTVTVAQEQENVVLSDPVAVKRVLKVVWDTVKNDKCFSNAKLYFDGVKNFYTTQRLALETQQIRVLVKEDEVDSEYMVKYSFTHHFVNVDPRHFTSDAVQALDIALGSGPSEKKVAIGSKIFDLQDDRSRFHQPFSLGLNLELRFGFYKSARLTEMGILLNIDQAAAVFTVGGPMIRVIGNIVNWHPKFGQSKNPKQIHVIIVDENLRLKLEKELKGLRFETVLQSRPTYKRKYRIDGIGLKRADEEMFFWKEKNRTVSVAQYYREQYGEAIPNAHLPCIRVKDIHFPMDVCHLLKDQYYSKKLHEKIQGDVTPTTAKRPSERMVGIITARDLVSQSNTIPDVLISRKPVEVDARILDPPTILFNGGGTRTPSLTPERGNPCDYNMNGLKLFKTIPLKIWAIIQVTRGQTPVPHRKQSIQMFAEKLIAQGAKMGLQMAKPALPSHVYTNGPELKTFMANGKRLMPGIQLMMFIKPSGDNDIYKDIKAAGNEVGIITQCVQWDIERFERVPEKMMKFTFLENNILKMNAKLGGINGTIQDVKMPEFLKRDGIMIVGLDVSHPAPGDKTTKSVAGFVASYDKTYTQYMSDARVQQIQREEVIPLYVSTVTEVMKSFFKDYAAKNGNKYPQYVIVYRDGVSEGQFIQVMDQEVFQIKKAIQELKFKAKIVFISVQKRHNVRMFENRGIDAKGNYILNNVKPGTVVDTGIVHPERYECYINTHHAILGTSRPAHYCVIHNEIGSDFSSDTHHLIAYYLCYLCARCPKPISIPIPVKYAHLVAEKASQILESNSRAGGGRANDAELVRVARALSDKLFYA